MTVKITQIDETHGLMVVKVEGRLMAADAVMLTWILTRLDDGEAISIDISGVTFIDGESAATVRLIEDKGARLIGADFFIRSVIDAYSSKKK